MEKNEEIYVDISYYCDRCGNRDLSDVTTKGAEKIIPRYEPEIVKLPQPRYVSNTLIEKALSERRSIRDYKREGGLLWLTKVIRLDFP